jgi:hypothetical protein
MPSFTTDIIRQAERQNILLSSYVELMQELYHFDIYLPPKYTIEPISIPSNRKDEQHYLVAHRIYKLVKMIW